MIYFNYNRNYRDRNEGTASFPSIGQTPTQLSAMKRHPKQQRADSLGMLKKEYDLARKSYSQMGVNADAAIRHALQIPISVHCWQADDVAGLENKQGVTNSGGIMATGSYPGRARNGREMRQDLATVIKLLPGIHRVNLHAFYAETKDRIIDRDKLDVSHFAQWIAWAKSQGVGLDFNTTFFAHPKAAEGYTLSHADPAIRKFWIRAWHCLSPYSRGHGARDRFAMPVEPLAAGLRERRDRRSLVTA